jgi:hypothetical protein
LEEIFEAISKDVEEQKIERLWYVWMFYFLNQNLIFIWCANFNAKKMCLDDE